MTRAASWFIFVLVVSTAASMLLRMADHTGPVADSARPVRAMTLNVQRFLAGDGRVRSNLQGILDLIRANQADIVALQETDSRMIFGGNQDGVAWLANRLGYFYFRGPPISWASPGVALLSRWPIRQAASARLTSGFSIARAAVHVVVVSPRGPFSVVVAHLQWADDYLPGEPTAHYRSDQLAQSMEVLRLARSGDTALILGDFNAGPGAPGPAYDLFARSFRDAWLDGHSREDSAGMTWPASAPRTRIDFIWIPESWAVVAGSARTVGGADVSDHRGVVAALQPIRNLK